MDPLSEVDREKRILALHDRILALGMCAESVRLRDELLALVKDRSPEMVRALIGAREERASPELVTGNKQWAARVGANDRALKTVDRVCRGALIGAERPTVVVGIHR